jgi:hypothetical protein
MGAFASALGLASGGGLVPSVSPSSSASSGPQAGTTGSVVQNFGGINLGNQDIPLSASTTSATNQTPTTGNVPAIASAVTTLEAYLPYALMIGAAVALYLYWRKHG